MKVCAILLLASLAAGCAGSPPAPPARASTPPSAATASPATAPAATTAASSKTTIAATITTAEDGTRTRMTGYRKVERGGQVLYCKKDPTTGSRVKAPEVCVTEADLRRTADDSQEYLRDLQRPAEGETKINAGPGGY